MTKIVALVGPSGCGKTTIAEELTKTGELVKVVTTTTREPRKNEVNGVDYFFIKEADFRHEDFLETTFYAGHHYGTFRGEIERIITDGKTPVLVLDENGVRALEREYGKNAVVSIYINRNTRDVVAAINARNISAEEKEERIQQLVSDTKAKNVCRYILENRMIPQTVRELWNILIKEGAVKEVLAV